MTFLTIIQVNIRNLNLEQMKSVDLINAYYNSGSLSIRYQSITVSMVDIISTND